MRQAHAALLALALLGCTDQEAERRAAREREDAQRTAREAVTTRLAPAVRKLVAKIDQLGPALPGVPRAASDASPPVTNPKMVLSELKLSDKAGNTDVLFATELALLQRGMIGTANFHLRGRAPDVRAEDLEDVYARALRTRFFLVIRADEQKKPKITGGNSYTDGWIDGDVVVFDLDADPPRALGSFAIAVELKETVKVRSGTSREMVQHALDEALRRTALAAIDKALSKQGAPR